jgi:peptidoglycan/xylan/chitin deacetylase (PgdA/CDA1 family)
LFRRDLIALAVAATGGGASALAGDLVEPGLRLARADGAPPAVALTLDACPGTFDTRIADALAQERIPATIFVTAVWMRSNPAGLDFLLAHRDLFTLENHGARHLPPVLGERPVFGLRPAGSVDAIRQEVADGAAAILAATGRTPRWYRGAAGLYSPAALPVIREMGFRIAGYSLVSDMGASLPAASVEARIARAPSGSVIIGHINQPRRSSGAGIAAGVLALRREGILFAGLDEAVAV